MNTFNLKLLTAIFTLGFASVNAFADDNCCKDLLNNNYSTATLTAVIRFKSPLVKPVDELKNFELPTEIPQLFTLKDSLIFEAPSPVAEFEILTDLPVENLGLTTLVEIIKFATPGLNAQLKDAANL